MSKALMPSLMSKIIDAIRVNHALYKVGALHARRILTFTSRAELYALYETAAQLPLNTQALEIGSYLGASACYLAAGLAERNGHLFCVDTWKNENMPEGSMDTFSIFQRNTEPLEQWITVVRKRSDEIIESDVPRPLGFVFIDGDHSYESAKHDFRLASQWLVAAGMVALHDCAAYKGVSRTIGEALASGEWALARQINNLCFLKRAQHLLD